jgi:serine phosphatase RsbU (regulator of sigma subunit)
VSRVDPRTPRRFTVEHLPDGALLCMFTDGLVERRATNIDDSLARLCATLSSPPVTSAESACAEVMDAMLGDREPDDDVSVLVVARIPTD